MRRITLKGRIASKGVGEGEALVTKDRICFCSDVDVLTGVINEPTFELRGQNVSGKVLVFPMGRGSSGGPYGLYMLKKAGKFPRAIINVEADHVSVSGAILSSIPMVYRLEPNPMDVIETGDHVQVDGDHGIVVVTKKESSGQKGGDDQ
jgi:uncharacterized protein